MQSIKRMVATLIDNPDVLGLLEYGSSSAGDAQIPGDYDLLVILNNKTPEVESLHFYVDGIPVDLNLRTLDEIHKVAHVTGFDRILLDGKVIYYPSGSLRGSGEVRIHLDLGSRVSAQETDGDIWNGCILMLRILSSEPWLGPLNTKPPQT